MSRSPQRSVHEWALVFEDALRELGYEVRVDETSTGGFLVRAFDERTGRLAGAFGVVRHGEVETKGETDMEEDILERARLSGSFAGAGKLSVADKEVLARQAGEAYATAQVESDTFRNYVVDDLLRAEQMSPRDIAPEFGTEKIAKNKRAAKKLAHTFLQSLRWDIERDFAIADFAEFLADVGLDVDDVKSARSVSQAMWEGVRSALEESEGAQERLAEEIIMPVSKQILEERRT